ncbi:MAG: hypothetical protein QOF70_6472, partial [Acetobacteraceae bacterium]|nr:hypothetical protein [Acetobacteraceae bacterium]
KLPSKGNYNDRDYSRCCYERNPAGERGSRGFACPHLCSARTYLLLVIGLGGMIVPEVVSHPVISRGVVPSLLGAVWVLAFVGLKYPLQMLPLLMFEFAWKSIWMLAYGLPQWYAGQLPATFAEDSFNIGVGVILMPFVIPWGYVYRHYVKQSGARWR